MNASPNSIENLDILLVEDDPDMRALLRNMIAEMGITRISEAAEARTALASLSQASSTVNLIICDWNMPEMSGVELLRQVRTIKPNVPFLMITGRADLDSIVEAKSSGVTAYLRKPFSANQLEAKLRIITQRMAA